jgi:AGZA family xanthine/uracil permease-like MFS transporter
MERGLAMNEFLDRYFGLKKHGTDVQTELIAGFTTFLTMVYIVFVNPAILANAGMDKGAVFVATCLAAAISTLIMALYANYPIALAPGMGLNAFFAFTLVLTYKYTWQQALAFVLVSGLLALIISITPLREYVINSIPRNLKLAVSAGIGLFLFIIALEQAKIVVAHPATLVTLGDLKQGSAVLALLGFILIVALNARNLLGATLIGILVVTLIGTSTTTSYIESAAGVSAGGRTGLTAAFVALFFLLALLFSPLAGMVPAYATAAALLYVACVMTQGLAEIEWTDLTEYAPAVVTAVTMPLTYSIATGIGLGFITYALCKLLSGKVTEASPVVVVLAVLFAIKFAVAG